MAVCAVITTTSLRQGRGGAFLKAENYCARLPLGNIHADLTQEFW